MRILPDELSFFNLLTSFFSGFCCARTVLTEPSDGDIGLTFPFSLSDLSGITVIAFSSLDFTVEMAALSLSRLTAGTIGWDLGTNDDEILTIDAGRK